MAVKDVREYYDKVCNQYVEMLDTLKEMQEAYSLGQISQEQVNNLEKTIEPLKTNYERISWIMYLLNRPQRKKKVEKWKKQNEPTMRNFSDKNTAEATIKENEQVLEKIKK